MYRHVPKQLRTKLDEKAKLEIFVGFEADSKAYRIFKPEKNDVDCKRDVIFRGELHFQDKNNDIVEEKKKDYIPLQLIAENDETLNDENVEEEKNVDNNDAVLQDDEEEQESEDEYLEFDDEDEENQSVESEEVAENPEDYGLRKRTDIR